MKNKKLEQVRVSHDMSYQQVAEAIGMSMEYYWYLENGKRRMNYETALKIASVFNMKPDELFYQYELSKLEVDKNDGRFL